MRKFGRRQIAACAMVIAFVAVAGVSTALAGSNGAGTVTFKKIVKDKVKTRASKNPCTHVPGTQTMHINNAVFHLTINDNGDWATGTAEGSFAFVPTDSSQPSYSGHFTQWFGENDNLQNSNTTFTFHVNVRGTDGSRITFHDVAHMSFSADGIHSVSFENPRMTCP